MFCFNIFHARRYSRHAAALFLYHQHWYVFDNVLLCPPSSPKSLSIKLFIDLSTAQPGTPSCQPLLQWRPAAKMNPPFQSRHFICVHHLRCSAMQRRKLHPRRHGSHSSQSPTLLARRSHSPTALPGNPQASIQSMAVAEKQSPSTFQYLLFVPHTRARFPSDKIARGKKVS